MCTSIFKFKCIKIIIGPSNHYAIWNVHRKTYLELKTVHDFDEEKIILIIFSAFCM